MSIEASASLRSFHEAEFASGGRAAPAIQTNRRRTVQRYLAPRAVCRAALGCELRYFEIAPGGYSTLERHEHVHAVMILRGQGRCLLRDQIRMVKPFDLISIPSWTWHQFRATEGEALGFLCMVNATRDRPQLPTEQDLAALHADPVISGFLG